jgi:hypothetical protein
MGSVPKRGEYVEPFFALSGLGGVLRIGKSTGKGSFKGVLHQQWFCARRSRHTAIDVTESAQQARRAFGSWSD